MASDLVDSVKAVITYVDGVPGGGIIQSEKPLIAGISDSFATVDVYDGTALLGVVSANGQGSWSLQLTNALFDGIHDLSVVQVGDYGMASPASYFPITVQVPESTRAPFENDPSPGITDGAAESATPFFPPNPFTARSVRGAIS
ncbi:Ig-like domain-containing protein [Caballeronia sp.]|uniref:Ig-like domain-containing protein n=1 Tax=Caballeronia sp. TaxID=1931223 RepID=UPI003C46ADAA